MFALQGIPWCEVVTPLSKRFKGGVLPTLAMASNLLAMVAMASNLLAMASHPKHSIGLQPNLNHIAMASKGLSRTTLRSLPVSHSSQSRGYDAATLAQMAEARATQDSDALCS